MVPLKWDVERLGVFGEFFGSEGRVVSGGREGTPTWYYTYQLKFCMPPLCCVVKYEGVAH